MQSICNNCQTLFTCNVVDINTCFCNDYPAVLPIDKSTSCICKQCLHVAISAKITEICLQTNITDAVDNNWMKDLPKSKNLLEGIDYYTENGFYVFTQWHHLKRGYCCKNNCRHCAYGYKK